MLNLKKLQKSDPVQRNVEKGLEKVEDSPMNPPSAYDETKKISIDFENMAEPLKKLIEEHKVASKQIENFEVAMKQFKESGYKLSSEINKTFADFFKFFDENLITHNTKEEKCLFQLLNEKLIQAGEHSTGSHPTTAIDVMEDDHVKFIQLGSLTFNMLGLATRIKDIESRIFVYDTAFNSARELTELLRLHIYREDYTLFPLAQKYISKSEFVIIDYSLKKYDNV